MTRPTLEWHKARQKRAGHKRGPACECFICVQNIGTLEQRRRAMFQDRSAPSAAFANVVVGLYLIATVGIWAWIIFA